MCNVDSPTQLSILFFSGHIKDTPITIQATNEDGTPAFFKNGKPKLKKVENDKFIRGFSLKPHHFWKTKKEGIYSTNEEVLKSIAKYHSSSDAGKVAKLLLKIRELTKQISTYYTSVEELIYDNDSCVHPSFSHCGYGDRDLALGGTATGRLSCTKPNVQNVPKGFESKVKEHFVSRFDGGVIMEADFHQLEIAVQAQLSRDKKYIQDVIDDVDFHVKRLAMKEGVDYDYVIQKIKVDKDPIWVEKRSKIKQFSFARAYGAGARSIADKSGLSVDDVKVLIKNEELEYSQLKAYNDLLMEFVNYTAVPTERTTPEGHFLKEGWYSSPTGRRYYFMQEESPKFLKEKGIYTSFKPTEIKNYIVQGTATADIVLNMVGIFWREAIKHRDKFVMVNTVHDSLILDCKPEYVEFAQNLIKEILEKIPEMMYTFKYRWSVPIKIDVKFGSNWRECT